MKKLFLLCIVALAGYGQQAYAQGCCATAQAPVYNGDFAMLAMNDDFKASHADPIPFNYAPAKGSMVTFETLDAGKQGQAFYIPADKATNNVLLIFHEWWGLNDYIKREAEKWQEMLGDVDVYAVDLYDGAVALDAATAGKLSAGLDKKRAENIVRGVLSLAGKDKAIGTLGWCMGGSWAFTASLLADNKSVGTVMYYGFPETDEKKINTLQSDVLYIYASRDAHITKPIVDNFGKAVEATKHKFTLHSYDAVHAFANPSNPNHDALAATQAELLAKKFLQQKFVIE